MGWDDIRKDDLQHLSHSQISMYQRCPKQYEYRYVKGIKNPPDSSLIVGISVHKSIEHNYLAKFQNKKPANRNEVLDAFAQQFEQSKSGITFDEPAGKAKDRGYRMAQVHYDRVAPTVQPLEKPELGFEIEVPGVKKKLIGFIDVIGKSIIKAGRLIIDNKTTRRKFTQFEADTAGQLTGYTYAHKKIFPKLKTDGVAFHILVESKSGGVEPLQLESTRDEEQAKRYEKTVQDINKGIESGIFYPTDNAQTCGWCGYNALCQSRAVAARNLKREADL